MGRRSDTFDRLLDGAIARRGIALMGVCNVTPDSFSDGGRYLGAKEARARVDELMAEGADIVDIGGESTRPGAVPVPPKEQLARVLDVVKYAADRGACVSIDTTSAEVAATCFDAGACIANDVSCGREADLLRTVAANGGALILMHSRGSQADMRGFSEYPDDAYGDVVKDMASELEGAVANAVGAGVDPGGIVLDPGLGFSKNARHSLELLRRTRELAEHLGYPLLVGASRKSFLRYVDRSATPMDRLGASIAAAVFAASEGARVVRVHDVRATAQAIDLTRMLEKGP